MFEKALELIKAHGRIIIHRHTNPDGDAIGAQTGLYFLIKSNFPEKEVYCVGDDPKRYAFMFRSAPDEIDDALVGSMRKWGKKYPYAGYGGMFYATPWVRMSV